MLMQAYRELAKDRRVIDLAESIKLTGLDEQLRPKLAIAPAEAEFGYFRHHYSRFIFSGRENSHRLNAHLDFVVPNDSLGQLARTPWTQIQWSRLRAAVPAIPPRYRPLKGLRGYHVLWEAEWENVPKDPLLLKRIGVSHLFAVIAQWDLTPVEQAVLRSRYTA